MLITRAHYLWLRYAPKRLMSSNRSRTPLSKYIELGHRPLVLDNGSAISRQPVRLHYWEWTGEKPTVIFYHAASFHARCYDKIIEEALPESHVISIDMRGHGRSQKHPPPYCFRWFGDDLSEFILKLDLHNIVGIGHSLGGHAMVSAVSKLSQVAEQSRFSSLILLDPVILPHDVYLNGESETYKSMCTTFERYRRRKIQWSSVDTMIEHISKREPFSRWPSSVLRDYCIHGLDSDCRLLCSPDTEISIYCSMIHEASQIYEDIRHCKHLNEMAIHVLRCSKPFLHPISMDASFTEPKLATYFPKGSDRLLDNTTHLFPMENPDMIVGYLKNILKNK